jgi:Putative prokaryotic signal transducing protein
VLTALPHTSAVLLQGALRAEGVSAELERDGLAAVYGLDGGGLSTRIVVPRAEAERALRILSELESPA